MLKGKRFDTVEAVKKKVMEVICMFAENNLQHCFNHQLKILFEKYRDYREKYTEGDNIRTERTSKHLYSMIQAFYQSQLV